MDGSNEWDEYVECGDDDDQEADEEYEVEEVADDTPMRIHGRVFLGSIDAARNEHALRVANIGFTMALLGDADERVRETDERVQRMQIMMEDSLEESLLERLPALLANLDQILHDAEQRDCNVLVHCMAGRSRSPALVAAWMIATLHYSLRDAMDHISMVRPWVAINARFQNDLEFFDQVVHYKRSGVENPLSESTTLALRDLQLPRLDFGAGLVADIQAHKKRVTMRLRSDIENDLNSDLGRIFRHSIAMATSGVGAHGSTQEEEEEGWAAPTERTPFALLRIDNTISDGVSLASIDQQTLHATGVSTKDQVLNILQGFYPEVTMDTPLVLVYFTCL